MSDLIFAAPWWLLAGLFLVGALLAWTGLTKQQSGPRNIGLALIGLGVLLLVVDHFVVTDKEKVANQTRELCDCVKTRNWTRFSALLDPDVTLDSPSQTLYHGREELVAGAKNRAEQFNVTQVSVSVADITQDNAGIVIDINCRSTQTAMGMDIPGEPSSWKLIWDKTGDEWHLHEITCLSIGTKDQHAAIEQLIGK